MSHPRRLFFAMAALLFLLWGALALWVLKPALTGMRSGKSAPANLEDVTGLFKVPGVKIRLLRPKPGDTYAAISARYGVSEAALRSLNQTNDRSEPEIDGRVLIPSQDGLFHWVLSGQGLSDIVRAYGLSLGDLMRTNRKAVDEDLVPGEVLFLPGGVYLEKTDPRWQALENLRTDGGFQKPTTGRFADGFGYRVHPLNGKKTFHRGLDLAPGAGHKVFAAQAGRAAFAAFRAGYGRLIILDHGGGVESWYAHLSEIRIKPQQRVLKGDWIGSVGASGKVTGPHLHFEIRKNGKPQNPLLYLEK